MPNQPEETQDTTALAIVSELLDTTLEQVDALQQKVDAALDTAVNENGYTNIVTWDAISLAMELVDVNETFEAYRPSELLKYVRDWKERNGANLIEIKWEKDAHRSEAVSAPRIAIALAETKLIERLIEYGDRENKRANANALETMTLGRNLSIAIKAMQGLRGVMIAVANLRRMGGDDGNPIAAAMPGYICLQDGKELDAAVRAAEAALKQLEKEYPEAR